MKIYLAACEERNTVEPLAKQKQLRNIFFSFYTASGSNQEKKTAWLREANKYVKSIIVDSGAFSFLNENDLATASKIKKKTKTKISIEDYWAKYRKWIKENYDFFDYFVELDVGELIGQRKILEWREQLKQDGTFEKCITVYHPAVMNRADFSKMLDETESHYVALESFKHKNKKFKYNELIKECYNKGIKVHGFAMIRQHILNTMPFYSVDASTWLNGVKFGHGYFWNNAEAKILNFKKKNQFFKINSANSHEILDDNKKKAAFTTLSLAIQSYNKMEDYYTRLWAKRGIIWN